MHWENYRAYFRRSVLLNFYLYKNIGFDVFSGAFLSDLMLLSYLYVFNGFSSSSPTFSHCSCCDMPLLTLFNYSCLSSYSSNDCCCFITSFAFHHKKENIRIQSSYPRFLFLNRRFFRKPNIYEREVTHFCKHWLLLTVLCGAHVPAKSIS